MSNIHTIGDLPPPQNPWNQGNQNRYSQNRNQNNNARRNFGGGQSVGGHRAANPWAGENVTREPANYNPQPAIGRVGGGAPQADDDEPELTRFYNGHMFDPFWTDNFPPDQPPPGYGEMCIAGCGCSCCLPPCCSDVRKEDWKRLLTTFTFWAVVVEFVMLIIEFAIGGIHAPDLGPKGDTLIKLGAKWLPDIYCRYHIFRYITPVVLHAGIFHFLGNMLFTYRVMLPREVYWGVLRTAAMYIASGVGGTVMSLALYPFGVSVGASGALCGIFGGYIVDVFRMWKKMSTQMKVTHSINIVMYFIIMLIMGFLVPGIDNGAHLGGLLTGFFLGMFLLQKKKLIFWVIGGVGLTLSWVLPTALIFSLVKIKC